MSKDEEALVVSIRRVRLDLHLLFLEQLPVRAVLEGSLDKDAVLVSWEVLTSNDLSDEMNFRLEICFCAHLRG